MKQHRIITAVDVGTTKVCSAIAAVTGEETRVLGSGWHPSRGVRKGVVVDLKRAAESVRASLEMAENESGQVAESAFVSVGGAYVKGLNCIGTDDVHSRSGEITREDILRAVDRASDFEIPENSQIIHVLKRSFGVDGQEGISDPLGMTGRELSVNVHLVLNSSTVVNNIVSLINRTGVRVEAVVMQQLASGEAVLSQDERELGSLLIDIGGGTADLAVYRNASICHSESLPIGGDMITKDIAIGLKTSLQEAEDLKRSAASVLPERVADGTAVEAAEVGTGRARSVPRRLLCEIARARFDEILRWTKERVSSLQLNPERLTGAVLTGGGSLIDGGVERARQVLGVPVRRGYPINVVPETHAVFHPAYSTALGLIQYAVDVWDDPDGQGRAVSAFLPRLTAGRRLRSWLMARTSERIGNRVETA